MAFNERWSNGAIQKYMRSVRAEGPYLPSNVDFVAANNGLTGKQSVPAQQGSCAQQSVSLLLSLPSNVDFVAANNGLTRKAVCFCTAVSLFLWYMSTYMC